MRENEKKVKIQQQSNIRSNFEWEPRRRERNPEEVWMEDNRRNFRGKDYSREEQGQGFFRYSDGQRGRGRRSLSRESEQDHRNSRRNTGQNNRNHNDRRSNRSSIVGE